MLIGTKKVLVAAGALVLATMVMFGCAKNDSISTKEKRVKGCEH